MLVQKDGIFDIRVNNARRLGGKSFHSGEPFSMNTCLIPNKAVSIAAPVNVCTRRNTLQKSCEHVCLTFSMNL